MSTDRAHPHDARAGPAAEVDRTTAAARRRRERREALIERRMALAPDAHQALSKAVLERIAETLGEVAAGKVALYWPVKREISLFPLARRITEAGGVAALPVLLGQDEPAQFRAWTPGDPLEAGRWGIPYPRDGPRVRPDAVFVGLVGFDAANFRLGYGGGYYDRALASTPRPLAIGVGLELMRLKTVEPRAHEIPMDIIVTEAGVFRRNATRNRRPGAPTFRA